MSNPLDYNGGMKGALFEWGMSGEPALARAERRVGRVALRKAKSCAGHGALIGGVALRDWSCGRSLGTRMQRGNGQGGQHGRHGRCGRKGPKASLGPWSTGGLGQPWWDSVRDCPAMSRIVRGDYLCSFFRGFPSLRGVVSSRHLGRGVETARNHPQPPAITRGNLFFMFPYVSMQTGSLRIASMGVSDRSVGSDGSFRVRDWVFVGFRWSRNGAILCGPWIVAGGRGIGLLDRDAGKAHFSPLSINDNLRR
ncbi:MAG: hypothetical protein JWR26_1397 [Pedosphaera sp.]|nr:hypothetical protein [Pedosphaera sp.]